VAVLVSSGGAILVLLPTPARRGAITGVILFHFLGMMVTFSSVDPPGGSGPWLSKQLWSRVYRPYLSFLYMTNAYHFYSPEPGSPGLMASAVRSSDDHLEWIWLPDRQRSPVAMHYQRMLALPEHTFFPNTRGPWRGHWKDLLEDRLKASTQYGP